MSNTWAAQFGWRTSGPTSSAPWTPALLPSLAAWYRSDQGITIATGVSQWNDLSGNGNHLVQVTGSRQPVVTAGAINGLPALTFDGVDDLLAASFTMNQPCTVFAVVRQVSWTLNDTIYDGFVDLGMRLLQSPVSPSIRASAGTALAADSNLAVGVFGLTTFIANGASSVYQVTDAIQVSGNAGAGNPGGLTLGARGDKATTFGNVEFAEVVATTAVASAADRANMRAYVAARYAF